MDRVIRHAIACGVKPVTAIQMATINTAEYFDVERQIGVIAPGRYADILLVSNLEVFKVEMVIAKGQVASVNGRLLIEMPAITYPEWVLDSVHIPRRMKAADFRLPARTFGGDEKAVANVIGIIENQAPTRHLQVPVEVKEGEVHADPAADLAKVALVERHQGTGGVQVGLVHGFLKR